MGNGSVKMPVGESGRSYGCVTLRTDVTIRVLRAVGWGDLAVLRLF